MFSYELTLTGKSRKRAYSEYKNSPLPTFSDQLFFSLVYHKQYSLPTVQGALFGISQPKANQWIHFLTPNLKQALSELGETPARDSQEVEFSNEDSLFLHDGTERPIQRPTDSQAQKDGYSGKKKAHTVKNNVLASEKCKVLFLTPTVEGKQHDKALADESNSQLPKNTTLLQDTGFQGVQVEKSAILQPKKKPRGRELTEEEKQTNTEISKIRIRIEPVISGIQRCRSVKDKYRNHKKEFRDVGMVIATALHNFRLNFRPWTKVQLE